MLTPVGMFHPHQDAIAENGCMGFDVPPVECSNDWLTPLVTHALIAP